VCTALPSGSNHETDVEVHARGHLPDIAGRDGNVVGERAVAVDADADGVGTEMAAAGETVAAVAADDVAFAGDDLARCGWKPVDAVCLTSSNRCRRIRGRVHIGGVMTALGPGIQRVESHRPRIRRHGRGCGQRVTGFTKGQVVTGRRPHRLRPLPQCLAGPPPSLSQHHRRRRQPRRRVRTTTFPSRPAMSGRCLRAWTSTCVSCFDPLGNVRGTPPSPSTWSAKDVLITGGRPHRLHGHRRRQVRRGPAPGRSSSPR